jgi:hypothetical protein
MPLQIFTSNERFSEAQPPARGVRYLQPKPGLACLHGHISLLENTRKFCKVQPRETAAQSEFIMCVTWATSVSARLPAP